MAWSNTKRGYGRVIGGKSEDKDHLQGSSKIANYENLFCNLSIRFSYKQVSPLAYPMTYHQGDVGHRDVDLLRVPDGPLGQERDASPGRVPKYPCLLIQLHILVCTGLSGATRYFHHTFVRLWLAPYLSHNQITLILYREGFGSFFQVVVVHGTASSAQCLKLATGEVRTGFKSVLTTRLASSKLTKFETRKQKCCA